MIFNGCGCSGCLTLILGIIGFLFFMKFWFIILIAIVIIMLLNRESGLFNNIKSALSSNKEFTNKPGQIYKECGYCSTKSDRTSKFCSNCGKPFEGA